jgi:hypothetical protein
LAEIQSVYEGVRQTAQAFNRFRGLTSDDPAKFRQVMGDFTVLNVNNGYIVAPGDGCNGTQNAACTSNTAQKIVFFGNVNVIQYTMVHELGHRFNGRTGGTVSGSGSLYDRTDGNISVFDLRLGLVFGYDNNQSDWRRGGRGWGDGPATTYNNFGTPIAIRTPNFQQNSYSILDANFAAGSNERVREIDEHVADMFLNWVYAINTNRASGFQDKSWLNLPPTEVPTSTTTCVTTPGCPDLTALPGLTRSNFMATQMPEIFSTKGW